MSLARNFKASSLLPNQIGLNWKAPVDFNNTIDELIVTKTITHFPMELYNENFPNRATDSRPVEIFRGKTIVGEGGVYKNTKSLNFNGIDEWLLVAPNSNLNFNGQTDAFSISVWVKSDAVADFKAFVTTRTTTTGTVGFELSKAFTDDFTLIIQGTGTPGTDSLGKRTIDSPLAAIGQWLHIVATYDGSGNAAGIKLYTNGVENAFQVITNNLSTSSAGGNPLGIGSRYAGQNHNKGKMDEVSIYNAELTLAQVQEIYNSGVPNNLFKSTAASSLVSWWQMGDNTNIPIVPDLAGGGNDATMQNMDLTNIDSDVPAVFIDTDSFIDASIDYPTSPNLAGRLLRDSDSKVFRIVSNTSNALILDGQPVDGVYVILPDFVEDSRPQQNYELDIRTEVGSGYIKNLVSIENNALIVQSFEPDELVNLIFKDGAGNKFIVKSNTEDTIFFWDTAIPSLGAGMSMLNSHFESQPLPYLDTFKTDVEALARVGTGLRDNRFYYYTVFTKPENANVAQAELANYDSGISTQAYALSAKDRNFDSLLYNLWPSLYRELDESGDLEDLMSVFGYQLNELHGLVDTYRLQDSDNVLVSALLPLSEQTGLPSVGFAIGADTLRRIARNMIGCWRLKGSKEGIALFIKKITTWDVTNGTADFSGAIQDFLPNVEALRFFDPNLGSLNVRLTQTDPFVSGGRFAKSLPGIVIPGFFTFREFVITLPNVALYIGASEGFTVASGTTTMTDTNNNFGAVDSLVGNYLIPNTEEVNDIFEIIGNTATTITVRGVVNNRIPGGDYAILSPLNTNRFIILNRLLPVYIPFGTKAGFLFTIV